MPQLNAPRPSAQTWRCAENEFRAHRSGAYAETATVNPPYCMRDTSNGIDFSSQISPMRESFMTLAFTRSRCAFDL